MLKHFIALCTTAVLSLGGSAVFAEQKPAHMESHKNGAESKTGSAYADVAKHKDCAQCGMDRNTFASSRMLITYKDGKTSGTCSIHCVAMELKKNKGNTVKSIEVADYDTKQLINAERAIWVIGGDKQGVMTDTAKWAFAKKKAAEAFIKKSGGKLANYKKALMLAEKD